MKIFKSGKFLKIGLPVIAVVIAAIVVGIFIFVRTNPLLMTSRAISNFTEELNERVDAGPLRAIGILGDALEDGSVNVDFNYSYRIGFWTRENNGSLSLHSNIADRKFALATDVSLSMLTFDAEVFLDGERLAVGTSALGSNYYGITFSTFRGDIRSLGRLIGLDEQTMDALSDVVEMFERIVNTDGVDDAVLEPYMDLLESFVRSLRSTSERTRSDKPEWENMRITRIEYVLTDNDIFMLLYDLIDLISEDENLYELFGSVSENQMIFEMLGYYDILIHGGTLQGITDALRTLENEFFGEIALVLYIGIQDRLKLMEIHVDAEFRGEEIRTRGGIDFGLSAMCDWIFGSAVISDDPPRLSRMVWEIQESTGEVTNTLTIYSPDELSESISLKWNPENGVFILELPDRFEHAEITGVFITYEDAFTLSVDSFPPPIDIPFSRFLRPEIDLTISVGPGAQIRDIEFVNIDRWEQETLQGLRNAAFSLGFSGLIYHCL